MLFYTLRRLAYLIPTLLGITVVTFFIISLAPGNPVDLIQSGAMSSAISIEAYNEMLRLYGLDKPIHVRYGVWLAAPRSRSTSATRFSTTGR